MEETTVINIKVAPVGWRDNPNYVYIGRNDHRSPGKWGNPIPLYMDAKCPYCSERHTKPGETLPCYEIYLADRIKKDAAFRADFIKLRGKVLVCFCKPKPCHGDVIIKLLEQAGAVL